MFNLAFHKAEYWAPYFFLVLINDMLDNVNVTARLSADGCILYTEIKSVDDQIKLNSCLPGVERSARNGKRFWIQKRRYAWQWRTHETNPLVSDYTLAGSNLQRVYDYKYLRVNITSNFRWDERINNITKKTSKKALVPNTILKTGIKTKLHAYKTSVRAPLEYASNVWDPSTKKLKEKLKGVQRLVIKFIFSKCWRL